MAMTTETQRRRLLSLARKWRDDPLEFARKAFPWGRGSLEGMTGPDVWQTKLLAYVGVKIREGKGVGDAIRCAVASGHGVGKSGLVAWIILWAMSTRPDTRGVVTAETARQLETKTWAELSKWYGLCVFKPWFELKGTRIASRQKGHEMTWRCDAIPWSEAAPEGFAGLHNHGRREFVIFDEASAISSKIWEVTEGALTDKDTEIMWLCFGNPTQNTGRFFDCFNKQRHRWWTMKVDARDAAMSNKEMLKQWLEDYGEDSDFFRVRCRGEFPAASSLQFISRPIVEAAVKRALVHESMLKAVGIIGVDVARYGDDASVITTRFGQDARSEPPQKYRGLDGWQLGGKVAELYNSLIKRGARRVLINIDVGGVGASPADWLRKNGYPVNEINFGGSPDDHKRYKNKRSEMWSRMLDWLKTGGCIVDDDELLADLTGVEYDWTPGNQLLLEKKSEMKKRGLASPDNADSLALTFAVRAIEYMDEEPPDPPRRRVSRRKIVTRDPYRPNN